MLFSGRSAPGLTTWSFAACFALVAICVFGWRTQTEPTEHSELGVGTAALEEPRSEGAAVPISVASATPARQQVGVELKANPGSSAPSPSAPNLSPVHLHDNAQLQRLTAPWRRELIDRRVLQMKSGAGRDRTLNAARLILLDDIAYSLEMAPRPGMSDSSVERRTELNRFSLDGVSYTFEDGDFALWDEYKMYREDPSTELGPGFSHDIVGLADMQLARIRVPR